MKRHIHESIGDDDSLPVMVPRNIKPLVPISPQRIRRLRRHLIRVLRALHEKTDHEHSGRPVQPKIDSFAAHVASTACALCNGWCCKNGEDDGFLDERTLARARRQSATLNARAVLRLYIEQVPSAGYLGSCIFHGKRGCTLDRSLRSDICNSYFCGGLHNYLASSGGVSSVTVIAGDGADMRTSSLRVSTIAS